MKRLLALVALGVGLTGCDNTDYRKAAESRDVVGQPEQVAKAAASAAPVESKKDYLASTRKIGGKDSAIYYKEFLKNPAKFNGERINVRGRIMSIEEVDNQTMIQLQITEQMDTVVAYYPGSVKVYQDDWVRIYGEGKGTFDGTNRMGASMTWPIMLAKYVVKDASAD